MKESVVNWIKGFYYVSTKESSYFDSKAFENDLGYWTMGLFGALILSSFIIWFISRFVFVKIVHSFLDKTNAKWDDHFIHNRVFRGVALVVPLLFMDFFLSIVFFGYPSVLTTTSKIVAVLIIFVGIIVLNRLFNSLKDIIMSIETYRDKPIQSYIQVLKIIFSGILIILLLSVLTEKTPVFFLTSLGAISAILLLIFKDTILGFVGSIQLSSNDMIRIGDWITMEKFGADGDVEEINLTTVKVRNFDRTITTIPTYSFIADSFKNWRGMQESNGRRIKRALNVQIDSIQFTTPELLSRLKEVKLLKEFIEKREQEIIDFNRKNGYEEGNVVNGRRQTNIGLFRRYVEYYLKHNNEINQEMTLMVRQLAPTEIGLPIELYCFTKTKEWERYEEVMADIFDHLFAVIDMFELSYFESPSGNDFKSLVEQTN